jgi:hypothetical protein
MLLTLLFGGWGSINAAASASCAPEKNLSFES